MNVLAHGGTQRAVVSMFRRTAFEVALTRARSQGPRVFKKRAVVLARGGSLQLLLLWRPVRSGGGGGGERRRGVYCTATDALLQQ